MDNPFIPLKQEGEILIANSKKEWNEEDKRRVGEAKIKNTKVGVLLKYIKIEDSESSEEVDENKEMLHLLKDSRSLWGPIKGENSKKRKDSSLNLTRRSISSYAMNVRSWDISTSIVLNERKMDQVNKSSRLMLLLGVMRIHSTMRIKK
ncbi:hypothetical protein J1N35_011249 [Gossypium stocksii]|uniref:Uncharacterized protein n=1 Tax=Gossypium stocksii TaxID=47602 RepID=A0A9D3W213_9ROSI|nr:hypothetical protein J1N35_011249 [Gossypium stocksii]